MCRQKRLSVCTEQIGGVLSSPHSDNPYQDLANSGHIWYAISLHGLFRLTNISLPGTPMVSETIHE